jgi:hypothetical protein
MISILLGATIQVKCKGNDRDEEVATIVATYMVNNEPRYTVMFYDGQLVELDSDNFRVCELAECDSEQHGDD